MTENGLYRQQFEHDACGIGAVVRVDGKKSHGVVNDALSIVEKLEHRAGKDASGETGDGVGILLQISHNFFTAAANEIGITIGGERDYGVGMFFLSFFHGDLLAGIFSSDSEVIVAAADYLKAYAIDCIFTAVFFCYIGFYNGIGMTRFVMIQGILGAFCVRVPVSYFMSIQPNPSLFHIGLATPMSSILQLVLCLAGMVYVNKKYIKWQNIR